jgi:hypothetical protein
MVGDHMGILGVVVFGFGGWEVEENVGGEGTGHGTCFWLCMGYQ